MLDAWTSLHLLILLSPNWWILEHVFPSFTRPDHVATHVSFSNQHCSFTGWGPVPNRHLCQEEGTTHQVRITVRAWHDPYLKAAELTHGSFDFGLSPSTETICGSVCLGDSESVPLMSFPSTTHLVKTKSSIASNHQDCNIL